MDNILFIYNNLKHLIGCCNLQPPLDIALCDIKLPKDIANCDNLLMLQKATSSYNSNVIAATDSGGRVSSAVSPASFTPFNGRGQITSG